MTPKKRDPKGPEVVEGEIQLNQKNPITGPTTAGEHAKKVGAAALNFIPGVGSTMASIWNDYLPDARFIRMENFVSGLAGEMTRVSKRLDSEFVQTEEFAFYFERSLHAVQVTRQEEKIKALQAILINAAIETDIGEGKVEMFIRLVEELSLTQFRLLRALVEPTKVDEELGHPVIRNDFSTSRMTILRQLFPSLDEKEIEDIGDFLIHQGLMRGTSSNQAFMVMMTGGGAEKLRGSATRLAEQFIEFIRVEE